jgi:NADH dehydrogenase (ubiquinone) Fe-S protein 5
LKQAEQRQRDQLKAKKDASTAANSNLPKLNIVDEKKE